MVHDDTEVLLVLKTRGDAFPALRDRIVALHPYDCPEIIALAADEVFPTYLAWVLGEVAPS